MAKRKAKKKSPSSSRPPSCMSRPSPYLGSFIPHQKTSSSLFPSPPIPFPPLWLLRSSAPIGVDQAPPIAPPQPPSPKLQVSESSPPFSLLFAPVEVPSPVDSENDDSSSYNLDSSSHYGSLALANSELNARQPSPASSAPEDVEGPLEVPAVSPSGAESVHNSIALAPPMIDEGLQDPMVYEAATGVHDWQPVSKKHTSNRQPKIGSGIPADLALDKDSSISKVLLLALQWALVVWA
ncbi:hypothetical protein OIU85_002359 [Salix viminalis]|uniref:Uncharacterized protein n=1 Tax=Salix viminalis TaxID=40686 RepID=A0A9Q0ZYY0_SALVM|nr:hypothetical protein OIU85_002359 [Salix viminalis]